MLPILPLFFGLALTEIVTQRTVQETRVPASLLSVMSKRTNC